MDVRQFGYDCVPVLICHQTGPVSVIDIDSSIPTPGKGCLIVFTVTFNLPVSGHLHWKVALLWQPEDTTKNRIGTKHNWTDAASKLRREQARIIIGPMHAADHPLIECLNDTMEVTVMKLEHDNDHKIILFREDLHIDQ